MTVSRFLAGLRPNPSSGNAPLLPPKPGWSLEHRHAEGGPWTVVEQTATWAGLCEALRAGIGAWPVQASAGDYAATQREDGLVRTGYLLDGQGALRKLPATVHAWCDDEGAMAWAKDRLWCEAWEECEWGPWMLFAAREVANPAHMARVAAHWARQAVAVADPRVAPPLLARLDDLDRYLAGKEPDEVFWAFLGEESEDVPRGGDSYRGRYDPDDCSDAAREAVRCAGRAAVHATGWAAQALYAAAHALAQSAFETVEIPEELPDLEESDDRYEFRLSAHGAAWDGVLVDSASTVRALVPFGPLVEELARRFADGALQATPWRREVPWNRRRPPEPR